MNLPPPADLVYGLGLVAVAVNAASAVLETEDKNMDVVGAVIVGLAASLGGGSLRDMLLSRPVFWYGDGSYLLCALLAVASTFILARRMTTRPGLFLIPDAVGLALFTVLGSRIALDAGVPWLAASLLGVVTGVFGGVLRDVLVNEVPLIMRPGTLYATASWCGALAMIAADRYGASDATGAAIGGVLVLALRLAAIRWGLSLPTYRSR